MLFRPVGQDVIWLFCMRAPLHYRDSENADLVAAYTADGGFSWHHVELAMDYQGNGLKIVMRTADMAREKPLEPPVAWSSVSADGGKTWSIATPEPELPNHRSKAFFGCDSRGRHIYVYSDTVEREGLWYKTKPSGGSWSIAQPFYHENNRNSYPTLVEDHPGQWIAVWDSSDDPEFKRTVIRFGRLRVD